MIRKLMLALLVLGLMTACSKEEREEIKSSAEEAKEQVKETAANVKDATKEAAKKTEEMAKEGYENAKNAPDLQALDNVQTD